MTEAILTIAILGAVGVGFYLYVKKIEDDKKKGTSGGTPDGTPNSTTGLNPLIDLHKNNPYKGALPAGHDFSDLKMDFDRNSNFSVTDREGHKWDYNKGTWGMQPGSYKQPGPPEVAKVYVPNQAAIDHANEVQRMIDEDAARRTQDAIRNRNNRR